MPFPPRSDLGYGPKSHGPEDIPGVIKVPPHHPGQPMHGLDYPAPWLYRPFTVLPGYLPLPSPLLINRFAGTVQYIRVRQRF
jgi:hypothetical protein